MAKVLVVDDESSVRFALVSVLAAAGHDPVEAEDGDEGFDRAEDVDVVITDLVMPRQDGLTLLRRLIADDPSRPVIMLTARGSERVAVEALKAGAYDYLVKPFDIEAVEQAVARAAEVRTLRGSARDRRAENVLGRPVVGRSLAFRRLLDRVARLASRPVPVLVRGETGTGKELVAELLHAYGPRASGPRVTFNCAAVPADLAESELFGHVKGAFTGAETNRIGFFGRADRGTLVLDEVGELPPSVQPKLLRALQSGEIQPVGGDVRTVDVRVVACTHRDLAQESAAGRFRDDLYYRLAVVELTVPALRDRPEDIRPLAEAFRRQSARTFGLPDVSLPVGLVERFEAYGWPGNVRELENAVARLMALSDDGTVDVEDWTPRASVGPEPSPKQVGLRARMAAFERELLVEAIEGAGGNHSEAARRLGVTRTTLLDKLRRYGLR